jgi:hypothetical protein
MLECRWTTTPPEVSVRAVPGRRQRCSLYSRALEGSMASPRGYHDLVERRFMSASGTKATFLRYEGMSAVGGKADATPAGRHFS